jgi:hypothetical protein
MDRCRNGGLGSEAFLVYETECATMSSCSHPTRTLKICLTGMGILPAQACAKYSFEKQLSEQRDLVNPAYRLA